MQGISAAAAACFADQPEGFFDIAFPGFRGPKSAVYPAKGRRREASVRSGGPATLVSVHFGPLSSRALTITAEI